MTFLIAKAHGKPLVLLPAVLVARFQHPFLVYNAERALLAPGDLAGKRVGVRSYSVTTGAWVRGILADDCGVDIARVKWVTFEDPHVAEFRDPPSEIVGAVRGIDPETGHYYDDTKRYIDSIEDLSAADRAKIFHGNVAKVYPRFVGRR